MSAARLSAAWAIWQVRRGRTDRDRAYTLYAFLLVAVFVVFPVIRALWLAVSTPSGVAALTSSDASTTVSMFVAVLWACGLLVGRRRGPALLPPFLLHALTSSGIRRSVALRRPLLRSAAVIVAVCAAGAVLLGMVLFDDGQVPLWRVGTFVAVAVAAGIVGTVMWLVGQVFPRAAFPLALAVLALAGMSLAMPQVLAFTPWGWAGATYPSSGPNLLASAGTMVLVATSVVVTPMLLDRLTGMQLGAQAAQWERATVYSFSFDFRAATAVYDAGPRVGRRIRAVRPSRRRGVTFFVRDLIGQARTPGRSLGAIVATAIAGALVTLSFLPGTPSVLLAGAAGAVVYGASAALGKGLQHAASVTGDYPLYGVSDRCLVLLHALFPLTALLAVLAAASASTALAIGAPVGLPVLGACALGGLALALRLSSGLKGPLPPILLAPINTPAGDLSIVMQVGWVLGEPLVAILGALTIMMLPAAPIPLMLLVAWVTVLILIRWKRRR